jgi:hypothetical protein
MLDDASAERRRRRIGVSEPWQTKAFLTCKNLSDLYEKENAYGKRQAGRKA